MPKKRKQNSRSGKISLSQIVKVFNKYPKKSLNYKQLAKRLGIAKSSDKALVADVLNELVKKKLLEEISPGKYRAVNLPQEKPHLHLTGIVDMTGKGSAFVISEQSEDDIFVPEKHTLNALHGDEVKVTVAHKRNDKGRRQRNKLEGRIVEVINRSRTEFSGTIEISQNYAFLITDNPKLVDLYIPKDKLNKAQNGQKAIAKITDWPSSAKSPFGEVIQVLGDPGENETEMKAIVAEFGFSPSFPKAVEKEAAQAELHITKKEIAKRRDFRDVLTFTIDPDDAKDFDDALSVKKLKNNCWQIGVHIADVSHYMKTGSVLDREAFKRATSVYLVDRVIPMLPEILSNEACSLRPNEEKLCFAVVFEMDQNAKIHKRWYGKTVILSDKRLTYDDAQNIIEGKDKSSNANLITAIQTTHKLAQILRSNRFSKGSIGFERTEVKFILDEKGNPTGVIPKEIKDANKLIEEFMLLANRSVAEHIGLVENSKSNKIRPFVYRVHNTPDAEKLKTLSIFVKQFGYKIILGNPKQIALEINKLLSAVKGKPEANVIETLAIRTMAKAEYTTKNIGHYGLSFGHYSHFTSPIRRYPDLIVHRLLSIYLDHKMPDNKYLLELEDACRHCSEQEREAEKAERASVKFKQAQFLENRVGKEFDGIISGVADFGMFVELDENKCEGLVKIRGLDDDYYVFDKDNYCIKGKKYGDKYQLGDKVRVSVAGVDVLRKQIDFHLVD